MFSLVERRIVAEVGWCLGLIRSDSGDKGSYITDVQRVVADLLATDGGEGLLAQALATHRSSSVSRVDLHLIGQCCQFAQAGEQFARQSVCGDSDRGHQIRATDIANEQGVTGQHRDRCAPVLRHQ